MHNNKKITLPFDHFHPAPYRILDNPVITHGFHDNLFRS